jgi:superfamily I DNA and/or RNA helicase
MHPDIMRLVNRFYENRLSCGLSDPDRTRSHGLTLSGPRGRAYLQPDQHAIWIDSGRGPDGQVHHERQDAGTSKCNDLEALLIARCLVDIDGACRALGHGVGSKPRKQVGVITFYGRQVKIMREMMRRVSADQHHPLSAIEVDINTVDRYQGQERPIILVSMVRNPPWRLSARANTAQFERINVAFSRAQELLVVVGAAEVFANYPIDLPNLDRPGKTSTQVYRHIIDEVDRNAALWRAVDIVDVATSLRYLPSLASVAKNGRKASEGSL